MTFRPTFEDLWSGNKFLVSIDVFSGWVTKRSRWQQQWRRRYASIQDRRLFFSEDEVAQVHSMIDLRKVKFIRKTFHPLSPNSIEITMNPKEVDILDYQSMTMFTDTEAECDAWYNQLLLSRSGNEMPHWMKLGETVPASGQEQVLAVECRGALTSESVIKEGYLKKRSIGSSMSVMKNWRSRYFYLTHERITYAVDRLSSSEKGHVILQPNCAIREYSSTERPFGFCLTTKALMIKNIISFDNDCAIVLEASSNDDRDLWVEAFGYALRKAAEIRSKTEMDQQVALDAIIASRTNNQQRRDELQNWVKDKKEKVLNRRPSVPEDLMLERVRDSDKPPRGVERWPGIWVIDVVVRLNQQLGVKLVSERHLNEGKGLQVLEWTVVDAISPSGIGKECGVRCGMYIVSVNSLYTVGCSFTSIIEFIRDCDRPTTMSFARLTNMAALVSCPLEWTSSNSLANYLQQRGEEKANNLSVELEGFANIPPIPPPPPSSNSFRASAKLMQEIRDHALVSL